jgi:CheY-like chemotaxis protein
MKLSINVLVINDNEIFRDLFLRILGKGENVKLFVAENGYKGLEMLKREPFTNIFLDLVMPGMNGIESFERIQRLGLKVMVTFMTASSELSLEEKAKEILQACLLYSPFEIEEIYNIINKKKLQYLN